MIKLIAHILFVCPSYEEGLTMWHKWGLYLHVVQTVPFQFILSGYFLRQQCVTFQAKGKNSELCDEHRETWRQSVCAAALVFVHFLHEPPIRSSFDRSASADIEINTRAGKWRAYMLEWYHPGCLPVIVTICSTSFLHSAPCGPQRNYSTHTVSS